MKGDFVRAGALALAWGLVVTVGAYAVVRSIQHFVFPEPDPVTAAWSAHAGFFWRAWTVAYLGGIASFVVLVVARGPLRLAAARALAPAIAVAAGLLALQSAFLP